MALVSAYIPEFDTALPCVLLWCFLSAAALSWVDAADCSSAGDRAGDSAGERHDAWVEAFQGAAGLHRRGVWPAELAAPAGGAVPDRFGAAVAHHRILSFGRYARPQSNCNQYIFQLHVHPSCRATSVRFRIN